MRHQYELSQLVQSYGGKEVLHIDHLVLERGRIYGLFGPNGAGKTTLFNLLAFLETPSSGSIIFDGCTVPRSKPGLRLEKFRRQVVMVDQHPIMFSTSVFKNIEFGLKIRGVGRPGRTEIIRRVLELVDLSSYASARADQLSGGETQRLALARALALSPRVLLCDEPTANVDVENQAVIRGLLSRINRDQGCTILFTSHDRLQAAGLADETFVLEKGRLVSTSHENIFSCSAAPEQGVCLLQEKTRFFLPRGCLQPLGRSRIHLNPEKYTLERGPEPTPAPGVLHGRISLLLEEGERIRVAVNTGTMVTVFLSREEYQRHRLLIGDPVTLRFGGDGVEWL
ncbi:ATP-binding cassette domain-containing protein [Desulfogranum mediterraneum]|uniref:ATP-binding cassette domain-containing protein n=1 Tax=Desulfogranum mediterraneum TaxID=160661 RepID=UPI00040B09CA|nr:ABC transporter ATP-binding protein [Desulfogranum mediterraneum]